VEREYYQYDIRFYGMRNQDHPEAEEIPYRADRIDELGKSSRGEIRKGKYGVRTFQKRRPKAGGFK
jgi:hypothetical protein